MPTTNYVPRTPVTEEIRITTLPSGDAIVQHLYGVTASMEIKIAADATRLLTVGEVLYLISQAISNFRDVLGRLVEISSMVVGIRCFFWWRKSRRMEFVVTIPDHF
jgi:hypothetical protein